MTFNTVISARIGVRRGGGGGGLEAWACARNSGKIVFPFGQMGQTKRWITSSSCLRPLYCSWGIAYFAIQNSSNNLPFDASGKWTRPKRCFAFRHRSLWRHDFILWLPCKFDPPEWLISTWQSGNLRSTEFMCWHKYISLFYCTNLVK